MTVTVRSQDDPNVILGVSPDASDAELRAAYLMRVKEHPPDRDPEAFQRIRDAYEQASDPRRRIQTMLLGDDPTSSFAEWLARQPSPRRFVGPRAWLEALRNHR